MLNEFKEYFNQALYPGQDLSGSKVGARGEIHPTARSRHTLTHLVTPRAYLAQPLMTCMTVRGNWRSLRKPMRTQGNHEQKLCTDCNPSSGSNPGSLYCQVAVLPTILLCYLITQSYWTTTNHVVVKATPKRSILDLGAIW